MAPLWGGEDGPGGSPVIEVEIGVDAVCDACLPWSLDGVAQGDFRPVLWPAPSCYGP